MNAPQDMWQRLREMPRVKVRAAPDAPPVMNTVKDALREVAVPKPEAHQVEPQPIPDRVAFAPMHIQFRRSLERPGLGFVEIDGARHYGVSIHAALGQAVIDGAFGLMDIELPEGES